MNRKTEATSTPLQTQGFRQNSLNTVKIIAALQVLYVHTITHLHISVPSIVTKIFSIFMGVPIFFILSGFLMWKSIGKSPNFKEYATKRSKRIFPELWLGVLIEILAIIIIFDGVIKWIILPVFFVTQGTVLQFWTPSFLRGYGCGTPNGSLWTMGVIIQFYIVAWFIYKLLHGKKLWRWIVLFALSIAIKLIIPYLDNILPNIIVKLLSQTILKWFWLFIFGAFLSEYSDKVIPFLKKTWWIFLIISLVVGHFGLDIDTANYGLFKYYLRVLALIGLAYCLPKLNIKIDFSYGIYIYHMIIVNAMIEFGFVGVWYHLLIVITISVILAIGSYYFGQFITKKLSKNK